MALDTNDILSKYSTLLDDKAKNYDFGRMKRQRVLFLFKKYGIPSAVAGRLSKVKGVTNGFHGMWDLPKLHNMEIILNTPTNMLDKLDFGVLI